MSADNRNVKSTNQIEVIRVRDGIVTIDHSTGVMRAQWDNGSTETWSPCSKGYSLEAAIEGHRRAVERWSE